MPSRDEPRARPEDFSSELLETLSHWYGGQFTDAYRVMSTDGDVPVSVVEGAARELSRDLSDIKKKRGKGFTRQEIEELESAIDMLNYIAESRAAGHEPI